MQIQIKTQQYKRIKCYSYWIGVQHNMCKNDNRVQESQTKESHRHRGQREQWRTERRVENRRIYCDTTTTTTTTPTTTTTTTALSSGSTRTCTYYMIARRARAGAHMQHSHEYRRTQHTHIQYAHYTHYTAHTHTHTTHRAHTWCAWLCGYTLSSSCTSGSGSQPLPKRK